MSALLFVFVAVVVLTVCIRFAAQIARDAGIMHAGWDAAGWLTLGLIVAVGSARIAGTVKPQNQGDAGNTSVATMQSQSSKKLKTNISAAEQPNAEIPLSAPREKTTDRNVAAIDTVAVPGYSVAVDDSPVTAPDPVDGMSRHALLAELHAETTTKFVSAPGFGFERRIRIDQFETPERQRLYLPRQPILAGISTESARKEIPLPDRSNYRTSQTADKQVARLQQLVRQVRGNPKSEAETEDTEPKQVLVVDAEPEWDEWELSDWELVSILKHDPPAVYASSTIRMMHRPRQAATRTLDNLETDALARLQKGETLVVADGVNAIRMLGAVRATARCVRCHAGKQEGDLLGAFSYELHRMQPIAVAARIGK